jgi:hypothetical protein
MFVDSEGAISSSNLFRNNIRDDDEAEKYVILKGCAFDPIGKSSEETGAFA